MVFISNCAIAAAQRSVESGACRDRAKHSVDNVPFVNFKLTIKRVHTEIKYAHNNTTTQRINGVFAATYHTLPAKYLSMSSKS